MSTHKTESRRTRSFADVIHDLIHPTTVESAFTGVTVDSPEYDTDETSPASQTSSVRDCYGFGAVTVLFSITTTEDNSIIYFRPEISTFAAEDSPKDGQFFVPCGFAATATGSPVAQPLEGKIELAKQGDHRLSVVFPTHGAFSFRIKVRMSAGSPSTTVISSARTFLHQRAVSNWA